MIKLYDRKEQCTGCQACFNACPESCISMDFDKEGFWYPKIDNGVCIECGLCKKACPIEKQNISRNREKPEFISAVSNHVDSLKESSSGGIFSLLCQRVLINDGVVYGCAFDDDIKAIHIRIDSEKDLHKLRGSKYVQSDISHTYVQVKRDLQVGKEVVFSGTPCQIAGVKTYLAQNYDNLYLVEVLCHGVPSPVLFKMHIDYLTKRHRGEIKNYEMRSKKKFGWGSENRTYYEVESANKTSYHHPLFPEYFTAFFYGINLRPSCYTCKYSTPKRWADITLGDFWGYYRTYKKHYPQGISVVGINNKKGQEIINNVADKMDFDTVTFDQATSSNIHFRYPMQRMKQRDRFYKDIEKYGYKNIYKQVYMKYRNKNKLLKTFYGRFVPGVIRQKITDIK